MSDDVRECRKRRYASRGEATLGMEQILRRHYEQTGKGDLMNVYWCIACNAFHFGHSYPQAKGTS